MNAGFQFIEQPAQRLAVFGRQLRLHQVVHQGNQRPAAKFVGGRLQSSANQFVSIDSRFKLVRPGLTVASDELLDLQPFQQLLDSGVVSTGAVWIENIGQFADSAAATGP